MGDEENECELFSKQERERERERESTFYRHASVNMYRHRITVAVKFLYTITEKESMVLFLVHDAQLHPLNNNNKPGRTHDS